MVVERMGKAIRTPARDVMLSCASEPVGRGWAFGLHEAMDQIGAVIGPLVVAAVFHFGGGYQASFGILLFPALIALGVLFAAKLSYPNPRDLQPASVELESKGILALFGSTWPRSASLPQDMRIFHWWPIISKKLWWPLIIGFRYFMP